MEMRILSLLIVVCGFALLTFWVYRPANRERLEAHGRLPIDSPQSDSKDSGDHQ